MSKKAKPTIAVIHPDGPEYGYCVIYKEDFDPDVHVEYKAPTAPSPESEDDPNAVGSPKKASGTASAEPVKATVTNTRRRKKAEA